jgi:adenylylsulfate kinase
VSEDSGSGCVVWLTGRPSSGKSTLGRRLLDELRARAQPACVLDGDAVRKALVPPLGYDDAAREAFYATLANLAAVLAGQGLIVLVAATAHRQSYRDRARSVAPRFIEVYVDTAPEEAARRDSKGLYAAARHGQVRDLPGADAAYEPPELADVRASGGKDSAAIERILALVSPRGSHLATRASTMTNIHTLLTKDHERLERLFRDLENAVEGADQPTIQRGWGEFERGLLAHLDAEERLLFPLLEAEHPRDVTRALQEHARVRALLADLGVRTDLHLLRKDVAAELLSRLREHAAWEDQTLYPWAAAKANEQTGLSLREALAGGAGQ